MKISLSHQNLEFRMQKAALPLSLSLPNFLPLSLQLLLYLGQPHHLLLGLVVLALQRGGRLPLSSEPLDDLLHLSHPGRLLHLLEQLHVVGDGSGACRAARLNKINQFVSSPDLLYLVVLHGERGGGGCQAPGASRPQQIRIKPGVEVLLLLQSSGCVVHFCSSFLLQRRKHFLPVFTFLFQPISELDCFSVVFFQEFCQNIFIPSMKKLINEETSLFILLFENSFQLCLLPGVVHLLSPQHVVDDIILVSHHVGFIHLQRYLVDLILQVSLSLYIFGKYNGSLLV